VVLTLWVSNSGGASTLNGSSTSSIVASGKDEDRRMGVGSVLGARVDDWPEGEWTGVV